jgi:subtilase family serine protease
MFAKSKRPQPIGQPPRGRVHHRARLSFEELESRILLTTGFPGFAKPLIAQPETVTNPSPRGLVPAQIAHAYGFDAINFVQGGATVRGNGAGQTIAIIDGFGDAQIANDLAVFDSTFKLPAPPSFKMVGENGGAVPARSDQLWALEASLDVEWAHALAPAANILMVETNTDSLPDLFTGVRFAAKQAGVSVVSMSFGVPEFAGEEQFDASMTTPRGHQGVTFVAASGDSGAPGDYPAFSQNVLAAGGTQLTLNANGGYGSETGWGAGAGQLGSGGGVSVMETESSYQLGVQNSGMRQIPDVAFDASPASGVAIYDTHGYNGQTGWFQVGGTSFSAPAWAALLAISNQGRALAHEGSLMNRQAQTLLYNLPASSFHDILTGNNGFPAGPGYDLVTGRGTPIANKIAAGLRTVAPFAMMDVSSTQTMSAASQPLQASLALDISPTASPALGAPAFLLPSTLAPGSPVAPGIHLNGPASTDRTVAADGDPSSRLELGASTDFNAAWVDRAFASANATDHLDRFSGVFDEETSDDTGIPAPSASEGLFFV